MTLYTIFEYCRGPELVIAQLSETNAKTVIYQILLALCYLQRRKIVHRDINPQNILFESSKPKSCIKLIDFGMAYKYAKNDEFIIFANSSTGTGGFTANEFYCTGVPSFSYKSDVFSVGATLYFMIVGRPIFKGSHLDLTSFFNSNNEISYEYPEFAKISPEGIAFIKRLMDYNTIKRPEARTALNDPWLESERIQYSIKNNKELIQSVLNKLSKYNGYYDVLTHVARLVMVRFLKVEQIQPITKAFICINESAEGYISKEEIKKAYEQVGEILVDIPLPLYRRKQQELTYSDLIVSVLDKSVFMDVSCIRRAFYFIASKGDEVFGNDAFRECAKRLKYMVPSGFELTEVLTLDTFTDKVVSGSGKQ